MTIGFKSNKDRKEIEKRSKTSIQKAMPRRSIVQVYFPKRDAAYPYYNDTFDLRVGDIVYVEGKLEGLQGEVIGVSHNFKIRLSDYKKVIHQVDLTVKGDLIFSQCEMLTFDKTVIPYDKVAGWFRPPTSDDEYVVSDTDDDPGFTLKDLSGFAIAKDVAERGYQYYKESKVIYLSLDKTSGRAIVAGTENYEVEFKYSHGQITNLYCSCYCSYNCKHEFAVMLKLKELLDTIADEHLAEYEKTGYFAVIDKATFFSTILRRKSSGILTL